MDDIFNLSPDKLVEALLDHRQPQSASPAPKARVTARSPQFPKREYVTESSVKRKVLAGQTTYTEAEVEIIAHLVEQLDRDPFAQGEVLSTKDFEKLGLDVSAGPDEREEEDEFSEIFGKGKPPLPSMGDMEKLSVTAALTTPDNTPGGSEPIPQEVQAALDVLSSNTPSRPVTSNPSPEASLPPTAPATPVQAGGGVSDVFDGVESRGKRDYVAEAMSMAQGSSLTEDVGDGGGGMGRASNGDLDAASSMSMLNSLRRAKSAEKGGSPTKTKDELDNLSRARMKALS